MQLNRLAPAVCALACVVTSAAAQSQDKPPSPPPAVLKQPADAKYPSGEASFEYSLDRQADRLVVTVFNAKGTIVAEWSGVAIGGAAASPGGRFTLQAGLLAPGAHALAWDLRAGGYLIVGPAGAAPVYSEGPTAPPGAYVVQVVVLGRAFRQPFRIVAAPPLGPSLEADLSARFDLALRIRGRAAAASAMVQQVREMRARISQRLEGAAAAAQKEAGTTLTARLTELEGTAGQPVSASAGAWPLQDALVVLAREVEAGGRPSDAQAARYLELGNILQSRIVELNALISGSYARFEQGQAALPAPAGAVFGGAAVEFDSRGVDFGDWAKTYVAALKQRWVIPPAAAGTKGRVVVALIVRRSGVVFGVDIVGPSPVPGFNESAEAAVLGTRPAPPLPDAFPEEECRMRVTFFFNELPAGASRKIEN